jgi:hypothetical protein
MAMTDVDTAAADKLLARIEVAVGELMPRDGGNAPLIREIIQSVNGLRALLGVIRAH